MPNAINRVFVTGASGKLGAPLCEALLQAGYQVCLYAIATKWASRVSKKFRAMWPMRP